MFCSKCGAALQADAQFCSKCGRATTVGGASAAKSEPPPGGGPIWNPSAAANWSIIFTPAFGSFLQAINWRVPGDEKKAKAMMNWFYLIAVAMRLRT
jgi:hypothetical protein